MSIGTVPNNLFKAAQQGDTSYFQNLNEKQEDNNTTKTVPHWLSSTYPKSGDTLLHYAARFGRLELLQYLHKLGGDLETANLDGKRPLHEAAQHGCEECLKYLLCNGAQTDCLKRADWTPLMLACTKSNLTVIEILIQHGANPALRNKDGWNSFHIAVREGNLDIVKLLLEQNTTCLWNTVSNNGRTPLHTAALHGCYDVTSYLLKRCGYCVDVKDSCGSTPLMDALRSGHTNIAQLLIEIQKADTGSVDNFGYQAIHQSAQAGCLQSVKFLVNDHHVSVDTPTRTESSPLAVACKEGQLEVVEFLLTAGANINMVDNRGRSALHIASGAQHARCVEVLLEHGAVLSQDASGTCASQLARKPDVCNVFQKYLNKS